MRLMHLQVKTAQNGRIKVITEKQETSNVPLILVNVKMLKQMQQRYF